MILKNLQKLNNEEIQKLKLKAPFSDAENHLLLNIPSVSDFFEFLFPNNYKNKRVLFLRPRLQH